MQRPTPSRNICKNSGFSLAEVLIAIGILAIGMTLIAAVFPAALKVTEDSANNSLGNMICENGVTIMKSVTDTTGTPSDESYGTWWCDNSTTLLRPLQSYPYDDYSNSSFGFIFCGRRINATSTNQGYQVVVTSYRKSDKANEVKWAAVTFDKDNVVCADETTVVTVTGGIGNLKVGSPFIFDKTGMFGIIQSVIEDGANRTVTLDRQLAATGTTTMPDPNAYVVIEENASNVIQNKCPAMSTMVVRTSLD